MTAAKLGSTQADCKGM